MKARLLKGIVVAAMAVAVCTALLPSMAGAQDKAGAVFKADAADA